ncbi:serine/threonine-protein kinase [Iningainema tapete]|uniref:non-specific serine/threonine protein kinase n=1 Tax=Iningainema tapete BLCC-T55 TaxID=2748662 RepID=A0A8J6XJZ1_9CYAN|nr:serine/threonine-protein kinase [Iningainema tapete]MBD2778310.1 serine/threonine protein kinase [Iningainema tapete BLCC-T55]
MIGKLLDHRYQVINVLATGGFGQTYIAKDTKRPGNPVCVVKHLKPANDPKVFDTAKRLFQNEADTLEQLGNHDQIPRLLAYFDDNQEFYLVQEFIEGHPLSDELVPGKRWSESQVIQMLQEVLSILLFVHRQGVIHRDIKPDNIIRRAADNKLVLVDFGAVKQLRVSTSGYRTATVAIGTPGYMPIEQGQGKPRPNSDIYALGIIAVQALTGVPSMDLQEDPETGEILWQHLAPVSNELAAVLTKMVRYHFKDRYQSVSEALQALPSLEFKSSAHVNVVGNDSRNSHYQQVEYYSPQSRQKTIAVAPANLAAAPQPVKASPKPVRKGSGGPDLLHLLILAGLVTGAAVASPNLVKNVQSFATNFKATEAQLPQNCMALVVGNSNIRSEPSSISSDTVVQVVTNDQKFEVTGKRTKHGWVQVKLDARLAWAHSDVIQNNEEWASCLRDKSIALKTVNDADFIADRPAPQPKPKPIVAQTPSPSNNGDDKWEEAKKKYESGDIQGAIALLESVTAKSSGIKETTEMINQWQQDWAKAEALFNDINKALDQGNWDQVLAYRDHPEKLPNIQYWRDKLDPMFKQAAENLHQQQLPRADKPTVPKTLRTKPTPADTPDTTDSSSTTAKPDPQLKLY